MAEPGQQPGTGGSVARAGIARAPESGKVPLLGEAMIKDVYKPLIFGNHQPHFKIFTAVVSAALTYYMVFLHDYGSKRHVFTKLREWKEQKKRIFFHIDPDDSQLQKLQKEREDNRTHT